MIARLSDYYIILLPVHRARILRLCTSLLGTLIIWPVDTSHQLQDWFERTNWGIFGPSGPCWRKQRNKAFRCGDGSQYHAARASLRSGIRETKTAYQRSAEEHLSSNSTRQVWQRVQHTTWYKSNNLAVADGDASLAEELNIFFARFEVEQPHTATSHPSTRDNFLMLEEHEVWRKSCWTR